MDDVPAHRNLSQSVAVVIPTGRSGRRPLPWLGLVRCLPVLVGVAGLAGCAGRRTEPAAWVALNELALREGAAWNGDESRLKARPPESAPVPSFDDPRSVLRFVMSAAPRCAVVYPTERYYYYKFMLGPRVISGNIRFADAEDGEFSVGYFDAYSQRDTVVGCFRDGRDGITMHYDPAAGEVTLRLDGLSRVFVMDRTALALPGPTLLPGESRVSGVRDESGYAFHLLYYTPGRAFYYVLDDSLPPPEPWVRGESRSVETWFGERSRFCFVRHPATQRFILVGVNQREIAQNTWYDGPFDQVPPRLPLRALLEEAYPYVEDAGGLDEHGNFLALEGQRVAISPYRAYESGATLERDLEEMIRDVTDPTAWTSATYEYKRDWRPADSTPYAPAPGGVHGQELSRGWPANHWGASSRRWGSDHAIESSQQWPVNHDADISRVPDDPR
ncbi:MAG: hypothetical protein ACF8R9_03130 [Phycisphaerales bacterium JB054]